MLCNQRHYDEYDVPFESQTSSRISTGIIGLDIILGGGWAPGQVSEILGDSASGKSTLVMATLSAYDQAASVIETVPGSFPNKYATRCGVALEKVAVITDTSSPWDLACTAMRHVNLVIIEGISAGVQESGVMTRLTRDDARRLTETASETGATCILSSRRMRKGGHPFWIYQSLYVRGEKNRLRIGVSRNPDGLSGITVTVPVLDNHGVWYIRHLVELAAERGIVEVAHAQYSYEKTRLGHGIQKAVEAVASNPTIEASIKAEIHSLGIDESSVFIERGWIPAE